MIPYALFRFNYARYVIFNSYTFFKREGTIKQQQMLFMEHEQLNIFFMVADSILSLLSIVFGCMHISSDISKYIIAYQHVAMNYNNPRIA